MLLLRQGSKTAIHRYDGLFDVLGFHIFESNIRKKLQEKKNRKTHILPLNYKEKQVVFQCFFLESFSRKHGNFRCTKVVTPAFRLEISAHAEVSPNRREKG